jgi:nitrogen fixation/metabolism regulation signal transduction histidine kinase
MAFQNRHLKRLVFRVLPILAAIFVILTSLVLVSNVGQDTGGFGQHYLWVLVLTGLALLLMFIAIVHRGLTLLRRVRNEEPGSRLSARWVRNFIALSLPPALVVYFFAAYFLTRTVDSWFDVQVESALADSLELGQEFLDNRTLEVRNQMRRLAQEIEGLDEDPDLLRRALLSRVSASGPMELSVLESDGRVVSTANIDALSGLPDRPGDYALLQAVERGEYAAAEPVPGGGLHIRVIQLLPAASPGRPGFLLQAIYPLPARITALAGSIEQEYYRYQNVSYLRNSLKQSFILILSLVLGLTVLLAILAALTASRRMVSPISRLAEATRKVAAGDLAHAVEIDTRDDLEFLARSFNDMTRALLQSNEEAESGRARLQAQGEYLETVLGGLSAGVLTLDADGRVVRVNRAAEQILRLPPGYPVGRRLDDITNLVPFLEPFTETVRRHNDRGRAEWQAEIRLQRTGAPLILLVRGSRLAGIEPDDGGHVVVFDDVTILNQAQRDAAWAEVARRLAHEVKNPLTPIRLAAERLRMKLMDKLEAADGKMLDRATSTIVSQVDALRTLVDAFGDYASEPELNRTELRLDLLVEDVVALYEEGDPSLKISLDLCPGPAGLAADSGQLRQLLHNLIRNATEAAGPGEQADILISSAVIGQDGKSWLQLDIRDHGPGFPETVLEKPFEPYVTHKSSGSGLGLAICRKIVGDHDGRISISNPEDGGAQATVFLPLQAALGPGESHSVTGTG